jgi:hypothetical protein
VYTLCLIVAAVPAAAVKAVATVAPHRARCGEGIAQA